MLSGGADGVAEFKCKVILCRPTCPGGVDPVVEAFDATLPLKHGDLLQFIEYLGHSDSRKAVCGVACDPRRTDAGGLERPR